MKLTEDLEGMATGEFPTQEVERARPYRPIELERSGYSDKKPTVDIDGGNYPILRELGTDLYSD